MFWIVAYPVAMLAFLVMVFDPNIPVTDFTESYRFRTVIGLVSLTIVSVAAFGMGQAMSDMRSQRVLISYMFLPSSIFGSICAILISRVIVIFGFSLVFILGAFFILDITVPFQVMTAVRVIVSILVASTFCFAIVLPLVAFSKNATTIIALANILNIYALLSSDVFIPLRVLPEWAVSFVTTSPFYYLNTSLQNSFVAGQGLEYWGIQVLLASIGLGVAYTFSTHRIMVPA